MDHETEKRLNEAQKTMIAGSGPDTRTALIGHSEFIKMQTEAQIESARATKRSAKIMMWTLIVFALTSILGLMFQYATLVAALK